MAREQFKTPLSLEYFDETGLSSRIGGSKGSWHLIVAKEMLDNALDSAEQIKGIDPEIEVFVDDDGTLSVRDNGEGVPSDVVTGTLEFSEKWSNKDGYVLPSRGRWGHGLKFMFCVPLVYGAKENHVDVYSHGLKHEIHMEMNINGTPKIFEPIIEDSPVAKNGSFFQLHEFLKPCIQTGKKQSFFAKLMKLIRLYAACNPHAKFSGKIFGESFLFDRTGPCRKWDVSKLVVEWYGDDEFKKLLEYLHRNQGNLSLNKFIGTFTGFTDTGIQKSLCEEIGLQSQEGIEALLGDCSKRESLLEEMKTLREGKEVKPQRIGFLNEVHVIENWGVPGAKIKHKKGFGNRHDLPFTMDVFFMEHEAASYRGPSILLNHSPLVNGSLFFWEDFVEGCLFDRKEKFELLIHICTPSNIFLSSGKNTLYLDGDMKETLTKLIRLASSEWTASKQKSLKGENSDQGKPISPKKKQSIKAVAFSVMEWAFMDVSEKNTLPAKARQIMYKARKRIIEITGNPRPWAEDSTFTQGYLPEFMEKFPELTKDWQVVYDNRGHLLEPWGDSIEVGTLSMDQYIDGFAAPSISPGGDLLPPSVSPAYISLHGHDAQYQFILYIEKEGFFPLFDAVKLRQRYDIAIISNKGYAGTSAKKLFEKASPSGVTILVVHDFDKDGLNICHTIENNTKRYTYGVKPSVIDIGFRLEDIRHLDGEEVSYSKKKFKKDPRIAMMKNGVSEDEANYLVRGKKDGAWYGRRVELNEMGSREFIDFLERKFEECGVRKIVPDEDVLSAAYKAIARNKRKQAYLETIIKSMMPDIKTKISQFDDMDVAVPSNLHEIVSDRIDGQPVNWVSALKDIA